MRLIGVVSLFSALLLAACGSTPAADVDPTSTLGPTSTPGQRAQTGALEGVPTPTTPAEAYTSRSIDIFQSDGTTLVTNVKINPDGTYRVELEPGTYLVNIARTGIDRAGGLPKTIVIESNRTVRLDIEIDTGIR